ncbi:MAG: hypothetical protein JOZ08_08525 [Verrucomicrobia bacterium]|nr:hypothetical protein [Verrucomicrobiota bacterium]MBV8280092.1 hypothetical protein [Verrucomicrobiota bacterium]
MDPGAPRTLGIGERIFVALACQLWLWVNLFSQASEFEAIAVSLVQLAAVVLIALRLRHMTSINDRWVRVVILLVVLLVAAVDLTIAGRELAGISVWFSIAKLVPVAGVLALAGVIYCFFKAPTRIMLLLYTVSFVAGMRAIALMVSAQGGSDTGNFGTLTIVEAVASMIYPLVFILKGHYTPVSGPQATIDQK